MQGNCDEVFSKSSSLTDIGLDVPQITKIMMQIKANGIDVDDGVYTVNDAFDEIIKLFQK